MRVCVVGHRGMLGNAVDKLLRTIPGIELTTVDARWPGEEFIGFFRTHSFDWIVNCAARIPQSNPDEREIYLVNYGLPVFLASTGAGVIHPSTNLLTAESAYALSKWCADDTLQSFPNAFIIRCSVIGMETGDQPRSLLPWFLSSTAEQLKGFTDHLWNGITTLQWAQVCLKIIQGETHDRLIIPYSDTVSKYKLLTIFRDVFEKPVEILPVESDTRSVEPLTGNWYAGQIGRQLQDLKTFYKS
ncbi:hypothetical protein [Terrimonas ferruginea]|uniref:hypothetical protein n=1 Tax=Terrimonas ferruginea TaxID=249 RepID=UPI0012DD0991|nr:hypothetical protein [Terrimonas ferruginea]